MATAYPYPLTNSEMAMWLRDPRRWYLEYYLGYQPAHRSPAGLRELGIRVHTALEAMYSPEHFDAVWIIDLLYGIAKEADGGEHEKELNAEHELAKTMVEGYPEWAQRGALDVVDQGQVAAELPDGDRAGVVRRQLFTAVQGRQHLFRHPLIHAAAPLPRPLLQLGPRGRRL